MRWILNVSINGDIALINDYNMRVIDAYEDYINDYVYAELRIFKRL